MLKRLSVLLLTVLLIAGLLASCGTAAQPVLINGAYTAEFKEFDSYGYKDFVRVVVLDGVVTEVQYDAKNADGYLRSADSEYQDRMGSRQDTYPQRYSVDLANQYLERGLDGTVDTVAGATWSSECFRALVKALESGMVTGNTETVLVDNVPEK